MSTDASPQTSLEVIESLQISEDCAKEIAGELTDPLGLIRDETYDSGYHIVRWPDGE